MWYWNDIRSINFGNDYVLATSSDGVNFTPSLSNVVADIDECSQSPAKCGEGQTCKNFPGTYGCYCTNSETYLVDGQCKDALSFRLEFTILEGADYSDDLQNQISEAYKSLQLQLEGNVNSNFEDSSQSSDFLGATLNSFSPDTVQSSRNTIASFTVFVNYNASEVTPELLSAAFNEKLNQITDGNTRKRVLGTKFVLAMSTDGINFTPSLNNVVVDIDECSQNGTKCGAGQRCENYPGTYRCYCNSPGTYLVNGNCEAILSYEGGFVVINRVYKQTYNDTNSLEYLQFTEDVAAVVAEYYMKTKFAPNLVGVRVTKLYNGSVGVIYIALFDPSTNGLSSNVLSAELEPELDIRSKEKYIGPLQLTRIDGQNALIFSDYDECNPAENIHIPDCGPNAVCINLETTYNCSCKEGYIGDGFTCAALPELLQASKDDVKKVKYMISAMLIFLALSVIFATIFIIISISQILERRKLHELRKKVERLELHSNHHSDSITVPNYQRSAVMSNYYQH